MRPTVTLKSSSDNAHKMLGKSLAELTGKLVLVGIPATTAQDRYNQIAKMNAAKISGKRAKKLALKGITFVVPTQTVNNAELVYIHTNGSALRGIPARPIIEPAIEDRENQDKIVKELELAASAALDGKPEEVTKELELAGIVAENAVKGWFVNPKNHWAPNAPSTIRRKGSDKPLIDTASMRKAMTHVVTSERG